MTAWVLVCNINDLTELKFKIFEIKNMSIGLIKMNKQVKAILNYCPHAGAEICKGLVRQATIANTEFQIDYDTKKLVISCPWHGWEFDLTDGEPVFDGKCKPLRTFNVKIRDSSVYLRV
jgi:nitrite reductase (NADH) small subunit